MKKIKNLVDKIDEEICGAKEYAEKYVEYKAKGDMSWANKFREMATQELDHSMIVHDLAQKEIEEINRVFKAPEEMQEAWNKAHISYVERVAWVRQMLQM